MTLLVFFEIFNTTVHINRMEQIKTPMESIVIFHYHIDLWKTDVPISRLHLFAF
jgi:hypothetical protein